MALNEMKDGMDAKICRSDSRQRPDIRALEIGAFELAASEKARLEDKQREYRQAPTHLSGPSVRKLIRFLNAFGSDLQY